MRRVDVPYYCVQFPTVLIIVARVIMLLSLATTTLRSGSMGGRL